jgi:hypothetical protein
VSALVLSERPLRLWDDPAGRRPRNAGAPTETDAPPAEPGAPSDEPSAPPEHYPQGVGAGPTLADVLASAWEGLVAHTTVACPVCHGELAPHGAGGRCRNCGTTLS